MGTQRFINVIDTRLLPRIMMNDVQVKFQTSVYYLEVTISNTLSWEMHVNSTTKKIRAALYQLKLCKNLPDHLWIGLVTWLILPHIDYCCATFTNITAEHNTKLSRIFNACLRFIYNVRYDDHILPHYKRARWL